MKTSKRRELNDCRRCDHGMLEEKILKFISSSSSQNFDFHERAAIFDHTVWSALSLPHTSRAPGFKLATQDHTQARDSNAAPGNTQDDGDLEATLADLFRKECQGCSETRRPSRSAPQI